MRDVDLDMLAATIVAALQGLFPTAIDQWRKLPPPRT